jgi:hypothetical protein
VPERTCWCENVLAWGNHDAAPPPAPTVMSLGERAGTLSAGEPKPLRTAHPPGDGRTTEDPATTSPVRARTLVQLYFADSLATSEACQAKRSLPARFFSSAHFRSLSPDGPRRGTPQATAGKATEDRGPTCVGPRARLAPHASRSGRNVAALDSVIKGKRVATVLSGG